MAVRKVTADEVAPQVMCFRAADGSYHATSKQAFEQTLLSVPGQCKQEVRGWLRQCADKWTPIAMAWEEAFKTRSTVSGIPTLTYVSNQSQLKQAIRACETPVAMYQARDGTLHRSQYLAVRRSFVHELRKAMSFPLSSVASLDLLDNDFPFIMDVLLAHGHCIAERQEQLRAAQQKKLAEKQEARRAAEELEKVQNDQMKQEAKKLAQTCDQAQQANSIQSTSPEEQAIQEQKECVHDNEQKQDNNDATEQHETQESMNNTPLPSPEEPIEVPKPESPLPIPEDEKITEQPSSESVANDSDGDFIKV